MCITCAGCGHCKKAKPEYAEASEVLHGNDNKILAAVDCTVAKGYIVSLIIINIIIIDHNTLILTIYKIYVSIVKIFCFLILTFF